MQNIIIRVTSTSREERFYEATPGNFARYFPPAIIHGCHKAEAQPRRGVADVKM